ncbi:Crp/Fnr family transcriptional regulator [Azospirillum himalayense]|uniref:Crp/Fnr family transcriptional regulator n=1 Tax=Azospirillum himalayense TaxID=654847 RepID=A0ABW0GCQ5_9PROT
MQSDCQACPLRRDGLCASVADEQLPSWAAIKRPVRTIRAGGSLFVEGDENEMVYIVRRGWALASMMHENGRRQVLRFVMPGYLIGFERSPDGDMPCTVEALTDLIVCPMPRPSLMRFCQQVPNVALRMASLLAAETISDWQLLGGLGTRTAAERIARLLLALYNRQRERTAPDISDVTLPISQVLIADATGLTPVHVCRTLKEMRTAGLLSFAKGHLRVLDRMRLTELAEMNDATAPQPLAKQDVSLPLANPRDRGRLPQDFRKPLLNSPGTRGSHVMNHPSRSASD